MRKGNAIQSVAVSIAVLILVGLIATNCSEEQSPTPPVVPELCEISVSAPNGGEQLTVGAEYSIRWAREACGERVRIDLMLGDEACAVITAGTENDGAYTWVVSPCAEAREVKRAEGGYKIRVTDLESDLSDSSDEPFDILPEEPPCTILVVQPHGGEIWNAAVEQTIAWSATDCAGLARIDLLLDGEICQPIADSLQSPGILAWFPVQCEEQSANYKIRITEIGGDASAESDSAFVITTDPLCITTVISPNGGEVWEEGGEQNIGWETLGDCGSDVRIELLRDGLVCETIEESAPNTGSYLWTADPCDIVSRGLKIRQKDSAGKASDGGGDSFYTIRVTDLATGASDGSDGPFSIPADLCEITVTSPNGGEDWEDGSQQTITWATSGNCGPNVKIELLRNGLVCETISSATPHGGSFSWTAEQCSAEEAGYRIRVTDLTSDASDESDGDFSIPTPIIPCEITVTAPNGGEIWEAEIPQVITWEAIGGCGSSVRIDLMRDGLVCAILDDNAPNIGSFLWIADPCNIQSRVFKARATHADRERLDESSSSLYTIRVTDPTSNASDESDGEFTILPPIVPCDITVTSPSGGESWEDGSSHTITWSATGDCGSNVRIELLLDGSPCRTLEEGALNDGSYTWAAGQCSGEEGDYSIRVTDLASDAADDSDGSFTIPSPPCEIRVRTPNGGEVWESEHLQTINWTTSSCGSSVKIELLREGSVCEMIEDSAPNSSGYLWTVVQCNSEETGYTIRVTDLETSEFDECDGPFSILVPSVECEITVTSPNGGEIWEAGSPHTIDWATTGECGTSVKIEQILNGSVCELISNSTPNLGSYDWTPEQCASQEAGYTIRVTDLGTLHSDDSDGTFFIPLPPVECEIPVTSPNGGESWIDGTSYDITWLATGDCGSNVKIELLRDASVCDTIEEGALNDGSYSWIAEQCDGQEAGYTIRVTDLVSGAVAESEGEFTISMPPCEIQVTTPNGGEIWQVEQLQTINWTSSHCSGNVKIEQLWNGSVCRLIAGSTLDDGSYIWTVDQCDGEKTGYMIRVTDLVTGEFDDSDDSFSIHIPSVECAIIVDSPIGGESWESDTSHPITWAKTGDCGASVKIELLQNGTVCHTISESAPNKGSYLWTTAQCNGETGYTIRVTDLTSDASDDSDGAFTIATPSIPCEITVTAPNGEESWEEGSQHTITWSAIGDCGTNVMIELLQNGSVCRTIEEGAFNDGSYNWTAVQCDGEAGYKIRITDLASGASDESNGSFTIPSPIIPCEITVTSPNDGESWLNGSLHTITWSKSGDCGSSVKIEQLLNGSFCREISGSTANDGIYSWTAEQCEGAEAGYIIRVTDLTTFASDESDSEFTIPSPPCRVAVQTPNGGEIWEIGRQQTINWTSSNCGESVKIELLLDGTVCETVSPGTPNDESFLWSVIRCDEVEAGFTIRVTDLVTGTFDDSDGPFSIVDPTVECSIIIDSPNGGEGWADGSSNPITWSTTGECGSDVKIELLWNGSICETIAAETPNLGSFVWTAGQCQGGETGYSIRVTDLTTEVSDESDDDFTISLPPCVIVVKAPNGGDEWVEEISYEIMWYKSGNCGSEVKIELLQNGTLCEVISSSTSNDESYPWTAEQCDGESGYTIRVTDLSSDISDDSNSEFTIPTPSCEIEVTSPSGGEIWTASASHTINWSANAHCGANVEIALLQNGSECAIISNSTPNDGNYSWPAEQCGDGEDGYTIRITDLTSGVTGMSDGVFTIPLPSCEIRVTAPNGGESLDGESQSTITWEKTGDCGANVKIELIQNGSGCEIIESSVLNTGTYEWTVGQCAGGEDGYTIRVTDLDSGAMDDSDGPFSILAPCGTTVTSPNGEEIWVAGTSQTITWLMTGNCGANVRIELLQAGLECETIDSSAPNTGSFEWTAGQCGGGEDGYAIRVTDLASSTSDASDSEFRIPSPPCALAEITPSGGEIWQVGNSQTINWTSSNCSGNVKIELLRNGAVCELIAGSVLDNGSYLWPVIQCDSEESGYTVRVTNLDSGEFEDSDGPFSIVSPTVECEVSISVPNGGESWEDGSAHTIIWATTGDCGSNVKIELLWNGSFCKTIAESTNNHGSYAWTVEQCDGEETGYTIRVTDLTSGISDVSDNEFTIPPPPCEITMRAPNGGESWRGDSLQTIIWLATGDCGSNVLIELLRYGSECEVIDGSAPNTGSYDWIANQCDASEDGYAIRVTDLISDASDASDTDFTILPPPCEIMVISPNGEETWEVESSQAITWSHTGGCANNVKIELLRSGTVCDVISESTPNDGNFSWMASQCNGEEDEYTIRVTDLEGDASDDSDGEFTIPPPPCAIRLESPNGGESWVADSPQTITWFPTGDCGTFVKIELLQGGSVCELISSSTANDGSYPWTAGQCGGAEGGYSIRVTDLTSGTSDESDSEFTIPSPPCEILVEAPNGGESWEALKPQNITWSTSGSCGVDVKIEQLWNGDVCRTITNSTPNDGAYTWTARQCESEESGYTIRVTDLTSGVYDQSDSEFTIWTPPCEIEVVSPNGGEEWEALTEQEITWSKSWSCVDSVKIELLRNGVVCRTINPSAPNYGNYTWTAIQCEGAETNYTIQVTDLTSGLSDVSDGEFTIWTPPCEIEVASPNGGESWEAYGTPQPITWTKSWSCGDSVKIELLRNGVVCRTINPSAPNYGNYTWTAIQCEGAETNYTIQVTDLTSGLSNASDGEFTIWTPPCEIEVTSPNGGESWEAYGTPQPITWTKSWSCGDSVKIELFHDGDVCKTINSSTPNYGNYTWTPRQCWDEETGYTIRVTDLDSGLYDESDGSFNMTCGVKISVPNGGESWEIGSSRTINWFRGASCTGNVKIELLQYGSVCEVVSAGTPNDGSYPWTANQCGGEEFGYTIRVTDLSTGATDESDSNFRIPLLPCGVTLTSPTGGEAWESGSSHAITWLETETCGESVKIELLRNGGVCKTIQDSTPNDGYFAWTAIQCDEQGSNYSIRVTDLASGHSDQSGGTFTILPPP